MKATCFKCKSFCLYEREKEKGFCLDKEANPTFSDDSIHPFKIYYKQLKLLAKFYKLKNDLKFHYRNIRFSILHPIKSRRIINERKRRKEKSLAKD